MKHVMIVALLGLAACGADGDPIKPQANINIGVGSSGVSTAVRVGATKGPVSISVGL